MCLPSTHRRPIGGRNTAPEKIHRGFMAAEPSVTFVRLHADAGRTLALGDFLMAVSARMGEMASRSNVRRTAPATTPPLYKQAQGLRSDLDGRIQSLAAASPRSMGRDATAKRSVSGHGCSTSRCASLQIRSIAGDLSPRVLVELGEARQKSVRGVAVATLSQRLVPVITAAGSNGRTT